MNHLLLPLLHLFILKCFDRPLQMGPRGSHPMLKFLYPNGRPLRDEAARESCGALRNSHLFHLARHADKTAKFVGIRDSILRSTYLNIVDDA